jgi:hypothetical protein
MSDPDVVADINRLVLPPGKNGLVRVTKIVPVGPIGEVMGRRSIQGVIDWADTHVRGDTTKSPKCREIKLDPLHEITVRADLRCTDAGPWMKFSPRAEITVRDMDIGV